MSVKALVHQALGAGEKLLVKGTVTEEKKSLSALTSPET